MTQPNPYEPVLTDAASKPVSYPLVIANALLALAAAGLALFILSETVSVASRQGIDDAVKTGIAVNAVFFLFAFIWAWAMLLSWRGSTRKSLAITLVNLVAAVAFTVFLAV